MKLQKLHLARQEYGKNVGELRGKVEFASEYGTVELALDEELSAQIVSLCADGIVRATQEVAKQMTADVIEGLALPAPEAEG